MGSENVDWATIIQKEHNTVSDEDLSVYQSISYEQSRSNYHHYQQVAHAMIYARDDTVLWPKEHKLKRHAAILMQMRFDGTLGFPGGHMDKDPNEQPVDALNRELVEEINLDKEFHLQQSEHLMTSIHHKKQLVLHFYTKEVSREQFAQIEKCQMAAEEWGVETYGSMQVPLYLFEGGPRGFPAFLGHSFAGNAKIQLICGITKRGIVPEEDFNDLMHAYQEYSHKL